MSWILGNTNSDDEEQNLPKEEDATPAGGKKEETEGGGGGFTSFWGALNTLKEKSLSAIETTKKDFSEFGSAFSNETKEIREEVKEALKAVTESEPAEEDAPEAERSQGTESAQQPSGPGALARAEEKLTDNLEKLSQEVEHLAEKVWGGAVTLLPTIFGMTSSTDDPVTEASEQKGRLTQDQELKALQANSLTFTGPIEPENTEAFEKLTQDFSDRYETFWEGEVTSMLANPLLRAHYDQLVPETLSEDAFWCNYLFRKQALELKYQRKLQLESRLAQKDDFSDLQWDDDEEPQKHSTENTKKVTEEANKPTATASTPSPAKVKKVNEVEQASQQQTSSNDEKGEVRSEVSGGANGDEAGEEVVNDKEEKSREIGESQRVPSEVSEVVSAVISDVVSGVVSLHEDVTPSSEVSSEVDDVAVAQTLSSESPSIDEAIISSSPNALSADLSSPVVVDLSTASPPSELSTGTEPAVIHMHREVSGSPETSDWESTKVMVPSQSDSEPWEAGTEEAILKAMTESIGDVDPAMEGMIVVPPEGEASTEPAKQADDWDQWE